MQDKNYMYYYAYLAILVFLFGYAIIIEGASGWWILLLLILADKHPLDGKVQ